MRSTIVTRSAEIEPEDERSWRSSYRPFASNRLYRAVRYDLLIAGVELLAGQFSPRILLAEPDITFLDAGAESIQLATAAMLDPLVGVKIRSQLVADLS